ncbi:MAG: CBS domain-containing protein [Rhodoferax sp.]|nr:CBS domain-containing protein [Rhodoferax sp.]
MFSVYGTTGRLFRGSLDELRKVGATTGLSRSHAIRATGKRGEDGSPSHFADLLATSEPPKEQPTDVASRAALAAYAEVGQPVMPRQPLTLVESIMTTSVTTLASDFTVEQAWARLREQGIGQAPVVNADGVLVGLLSRADLTTAERLPQLDSNAQEWRALLEQNVAELMWTPVPSVAMDTDIRRLSRVLLDTGLPGLPVVDEGGLVIGFVSRSDILRAVVADPPLDLWT